VVPGELVDTGEDVVIGPVLDTGGVAPPPPHATSSAAVAVRLAMVRMVFIWSDPLSR
jgi:hypothetical protein